MGLEREGEGEGQKDLPSHMASFHVHRPQGMLGSRPGSARAPQSPPKGIVSFETSS